MSGAGAILGIDTATALTSVAAVRDGELLFSVSVPPGGDGRPRHASALLGEVETAVAACGGWGEVAAISVGVGPGSFTGLRVGISTARALGQALDIGLRPVGSLAALAAGIQGDAERLAVIDARRGQVFAALGGVDGALIWEPFVATPAELAQRLVQRPAAPWAAGDGTIRFRQELQDGARIPPDDDPVHRLDAARTCLLATEIESVEPNRVTPIYIREPDAELWLEPDRR